MRVFLFATAFLVSCSSPKREDPTAIERTDQYAEAREAMVKSQLLTRDVTDARVLEAMARVPRHEFVPTGHRSLAYQDQPLPIGQGQTISQPYIVAIMTQLAKLDAGSRVLEIGTGSGYQAAILAEVAGEVYSIEIVEPLAQRAEKTLRRLGYDKIKLRTGDGYAGWPTAAPFDAIIVTAAPPRVPEPLRMQLRDGGRLVVPVGDRYQELLVITRAGDSFVERKEFPVRFVPMTGEAQEPSSRGGR